MDIFAFMNGISPWWWVALALALGIVEVLTFSFFLIWPGLAALAVALVMWIMPLDGTAQVFAFAVLSLGFTVAGRHYALKSPPAAAEVANLNSRAAQLIGRTATVIDGFAGGGVGNVEVDGIRWRGRMSDASLRPAAGDVMAVTGAEGMTLLLEPAA